jgi:outer membrane protein assembly factor BamB
LKKNKNKLLFSVAIISLLTISALAVATPQTQGHTPGWSIPTWAYLSTTPNHQAGVGETVLLVMWLNTIPPTAGGTGGDMFHGFKIDVTAPDGSKTALGPFDSGPVGTTYTTYVPTQIGRYTFVFSYPGQVYQAGVNPNPMGMIYVGDKFEASTSTPIELDVTSTAAAKWQEPALPTGYWSRPINAQNREWSQLASNWLRGSWFRYSNYQEWGRAPDSAHIIWTQPIAEQPGVSAGHPGGIADAQWPGQPYDTDDYQSPWGGSIIMNGIIYYNTPADAMTARYGYYAVDLRTGTQLWFNNGTFNNAIIGNPSFGEGPNLSQSFPTLSSGYMYHYDSVNGQGIISYLIMTQGSTWYLLNPDTGSLIMSLRNVGNPYGSAATTVTDQDGSVLIYNYNTTTGVVTAWNSSQAIPHGAPGTGTSSEQFRVRIGASIDTQNDRTWATYPLPGNGTNGAWTAADTYHSSYSMNTTLKPGLPWINAPSYSMNFGVTRVLQDSQRTPQMLFCFQNPSSQGDVTGGNGTFRAWAAKINYNAAPRTGPTGSLSEQSNWNLEQTVTLLWSKEYSPPKGGNITWINGPIDYDNRVFTIYGKETVEWYGYSLDTGELLWGPTPPQAAWDMFGTGGNVAYGNLYSSGYGGILYCYDIKTGTPKWTYEATNVGGESPYGNYPLNILSIADQKIYLGSSEHSPTKPMWRGSYLRCVNALNGQEVFKVQTWVDGIGIADGYLVCANHYNNNIQAFGKGQTATTVSLSQKAVSSGTAVLIDGTVTDQSPGAPGTPAISDVYMQQWMEYLYMQQSIPGNAQGVPVKLTAIDSSGGATDIGTVTSDMSGIFKTMWTPTNTGTYTIVATFEGSHSGRVVGYFMCFTFAHVSSTIIIIVFVIIIKTHILYHYSQVKPDMVTINTQYTFWCHALHCQTTW